ncbi:MAG: hypothetical protein OXI16_13725 [Chloroflexota bacterium]|nr:hypothetical protein [Chloroflexota bacterium]
MNKFENPDHVKMCEQCPWRRSNHGKRQENGFYTKANLRRLWKEVRSGEGVQTCHLTDPNHPEHVAAGAAESATPHECAGSIALVAREIRKFEKLIEEGYDDPYREYKRRESRGMGREGFWYWMMRAGDSSNMLTEKLPTIDANLVEDEELVGRYE